MSEIKITGGSPLPGILAGIKSFIEARSDNPFKKVVPSLVVGKFPAPCLAFDVMSAGVRNDAQTWRAVLGFSVVTASPDPIKARDDCLDLTRWLIHALELMPAETVEVDVPDDEEIEISYYWAGEEISALYAGDEKDNALFLGNFEVEIIYNEL